MNIKKVIFPKAKDRPKTLYLKSGFRKLGVKIENSSKWMNRFYIPSNSLGPYVYPIEFVFDKKSKLIFYDINTTNMIYSQFAIQGLYFKIHLKQKDIKNRIIPAPNTPSRVEFLNHLPELRKLKDKADYINDFFFSGWCSANGLRIKACRIAKAHLKSRVYCGLQNFKHHRLAPAAFRRSRINQLEYWKKQATSKINLALPGGSALPWVSFRHVELWGIGAAVFTYPPDYHVFGNPEYCWIPFRKDFSNYKEVLNAYIKDDSMREEIALNGREYFDKHYLPEKQAQYFIEEVEKRIK